MRVRAALHVHSTLSHDGTLMLSEVSELYRERGFHLVAIGEHSQDMDEDKVRSLIDQCASHSSADFLMLPGIEFSCLPEGLHIFGAGVTALTRDADPLSVARHIRASGGFSVLAHPSRQKWQHADSLLGAVDAAELWNIGYDGKYLPALQAPAAFQRMRSVNPSLLAVAGHDLPRTVSFYNSAIVRAVDVLAREQAISALRRGRYTIESPFFSADADGSASWPGMWSLRLFAGPLRSMRKVKARLAR